MGISTGRGDNGYSARYSGERLPKDHLVFEVLGSLDELSSTLGLAKVILRDEGKEDFAGQIEKIQKRLIRIGEEVATSRSSPRCGRISPIGREELSGLEERLKRLEEKVTLSGDFILPGRTAASARVDVARSVCRRLERRYVAFRRQEASEAPAGPSPVAAAYLNRLSDYLYLVARAC